MQYNQQRIEKRTYHTDNGHSKLDVHSIFYTIQGEGPFCGTPAVFVRLAGCNLQCPACDTDYTTGRRLMTVEDICNEVRRVALPEVPADLAEYLASAQVETMTHFTGLVVITGGEPFRQDLGELCNALLARDHYVQIETNGTLPPSVDERKVFKTVQAGRIRSPAIYIVCSPKTGRIHPDTELLACCFKYVMNAENVGVDGLPTHALHHFLNGSVQLARPPKGDGRPVYLQPMDEQNNVRNSKHLQACISSCMKHGYILQLQIHKILRME